MGLILACKNRGLQRDLIIYDEDDAVITPTVNDVIRVKILREGDTPKLTITSTANTTNGSSLTKGATNRLRIDASDMDLDPGTYTLLFDYYDNADSGGEWKCVDHHVFVITES